MNVLETALNYYHSGLSVIPIRTDGSKAPDLESWKEFQLRKADSQTLINWFGDNDHGIGIVAGAISGGLEIIDIEVKQIAADWQKLVCNTPAGQELFNKLVIVRTPRGFHCYYRCPEPGRNQDLARRPATDAELAENPKRKYYKLIETRAEGGYVIAPGSPAATHPSGLTYELSIGELGQLQEISMEDREFLHDCARSLNLYFTEIHEPTLGEATKGERPGDIFNARAEWSDVLEPAGWKIGSGRGRWMRPGSKRDSACLIADGEKLWVFSTSTPLPFEKALTKYQAYTFLNCGGDFAQAAKQLALAGFCKPHDPPAVDQKKDSSVSEPSQEDDEDFQVREWPTLAPEAFHGVAGEFIRVASESSEADPAAILAAFLVRAGASFGNHAYVKVADDHHYPRLFALVLGNSSKSRKGTSLGPVRRIFEAAEQRLANPLNVVSGLSSGEGLIAAVRSDTENEVADKRLLVIETEFAGPLKSMQRDGNTLSVALRNAWDRNDLSILTRNNPVHAKGAHISVLGHCTRTELGKLLEKVEISNGLVNRFLWFAVRRSKSLCFPEGLADEAIPPIAAAIAEAIHAAQADRRIHFDAKAAEFWRELYTQLSKEEGGII
ncbi:MAG: bifunctional DNA primase/polymerase, partial [Candidatus Obscuribacterales bacterium]|nr:bifunctional DNA primase/polymerase [Candidatus Obscuribacterales bacterium]